MLFTIPRFDYSFKKMLVNPKKVYAIDHGFSIKNSTSFSDDKGRILENIAFIHLRKKHKDIFYFQDNYECDFLVREGAKITEAIQVTYNVSEDNKSRELQGLLEAMEKFKLKDGLILTYNQEETFRINKITVRAIPLWKWLLH